MLRSGSSTVKITANTGELESKIKSFVVAYNDVQDFIAGQYSKDGAGRPSGALAGNPTLRSIQNQLRNTVGQSFANNGGPLKNLTEIGIGRDENGRLTLDSKILNERLTEKTVAGFAATSTEPKLVQPIVTGTSVSGSTSVDIIRLATSYVEESAELVTGAAILANPKIAATFQLQTGGQASGPTFSLTSANNSLKALRDAINGANAGVIARIESTAGLSEKLVLTSQVTGASNRVQLVEITNPPTGTGSNLKLTATSPGGDNYEELDSFIVINDAEKIFRPTNTISDYIPGLALNLLEIGRATVTVVASQKKTSLDDVRALLAGKEGFQKGLANEVYTSYKSISDDVIGLVKKAITGNENSIKGINKSIGDQLARISTLRQSLSRQFAAADAAISQLNSQGTSLTNIFTAQNNASNK